MPAITVRSGATEWLTATDKLISYRRRAVRTRHCRWSHLHRRARQLHSPRQSAVSAAVLLGVTQNDSFSLDLSQGTTARCTLAKEPMAVDCRPRATGANMGLVTERGNGAVGRLSARDAAMTRPLSCKQCSRRLKSLVISRSQIDVLSLHLRDGCQRARMSERRWRTTRLYSIRVQEP